MNEYVRENIGKWNELVDIHARSKFYDLDGFLAGKSSLDDLELEYLGDIAGKSVLHLQCHFGMSTLSMARMGAVVTGVDFTPRAIELARELAQRTGLEARFIQSDVASLTDVLDEEFDIVFTTYGVLCWLPDLSRWAEVIAKSLKPGGRLVLLDGHPTGTMLEGASPEKLFPVFPYFKTGKPYRFEDDFSYADSDLKLKNKVFNEWPFSLSEVFNALWSAGIGIEKFEEYPFASFNAFGFLSKGRDGHYRMPEGSIEVPLTFGIVGRKKG